MPSNPVHIPVPCGWTRTPPGVFVLCCSPEALPAAEGCESGGVQVFVREKTRVKLELVIHFLPRLMLAGSSQTSRGHDAAGAQGQPGSSKVNPLQGLSTGFTNKHKICSRGVSCKTCLAQEGEICFVLFQFFEISNCVSAWQSWSPNTFCLLIAPAKSTKNTKILIWSITVNISQDPNIYREFSNQLAGKE